MLDITLPDRCELNEDPLKHSDKPVIGLAAFGADEPHVDIGISNSTRRPSGTPEGTGAGGLALALSLERQARPGPAEHDPESVHQSLIGGVGLMHPAHE